VTPIVNPLTHLACFSLIQTSATTSVQPPFTVQIQNQFGTGTLSTGQPVLLCLPSWKNLTAATALSQPPGLDHYTCYTVPNAANMPPPPSPIGLQDQFNKVVRGQVTQSTVTLGPPNLLCLPTLKTLSPLVGPTPPKLFHPQDHLVCYPVTTEAGVGKPAGGTVIDQNQFGASLVKIGALRELCVPSLKTITERGTGTLVITKVGVDPASGVGIPLAGATFSVSPGGATCTTDATGTCTITGLTTPGTYTVHEVTPPPGYGPGPDQTVTFSGGPQTINVVFTDTPGTQGTNTLDITKLAGNAAAAVPLAGATFTATPSIASNPSGTCTTNATGKCQIPGLAIDTYTVTETVAPSGYSPGGPQTVTFSTAPQTISLTFNDTPTVQASNILVITKVGVSASGATSPLGGATFTATPSIASNPSGTCTTNATGTCQITGLATDTYTATETGVPGGFSGAGPQTITFTTSPQAMNASFADNALPGA
jgi:uncharacterized surface anchored protein